ncbi:MAG: N-acetyltransferase [Hyphomicrobiaceae bacterium]
MPHSSLATQSSSPALPQAPMPGPRAERLACPTDGSIPAGPARQAAPSVGEPTAGADHSGAQLPAGLAGLLQDLVVRPVGPDLVAAIEDLHARAFGPGRFTRAAYRVREGLPPFSGLCLAAVSGERLAAAIRFAPVLIGGRPGAELLGPLAVEPEIKGRGVGQRLVGEGLAAARAKGRRLVVLVGDLPYYGRFGFKVVPRGQLVMPGPVDPGRLLALELQPGALADYCGKVEADRSAAG